MRAWDIDIDTGFSRIRYDKISVFFKICNKIRYLILFDDWCVKIYNRIKYLISEKSGITDSNHNFAIIRIDSYNSLSVEKLLTFHNVIILIKSVGNKTRNDYYYNIF